MANPNTSPDSSLLSIHNATKHIYIGWTNICDYINPMRVHCSMSRKILGKLLQDLTKLRCVFHFWHYYATIP